MERNDSDLDNVFINFVNENARTKKNGKSRIL